jgi:hypothetical protein
MFTCTGPLRCLAVDSMGHAMLEQKRARSHLFRKVKQGLEDGVPHSGRPTNPAFFHTQFDGVGGCCLQQRPLPTPHGV